MTNLEWVKENQQELIRANLNDNRAVEVLLGKITLSQLLSYNFSVDVEAQKLVKAEGWQDGDKRYIYYNTSVEEWLQAERKETLQSAYPIGTVLVLKENGEWYWYNGVKDNKHLVCGSATSIGLEIGGTYNTDTLNEMFRPLTIGEVYGNHPYCSLVVYKKHHDK